MDTGLNPNANELINMLQLEPHPEGGNYSRTYASDEQVPAAALPERLFGISSHQER
jgi:predicted cupin superfamily sugar epimerase